jgi:hypothetical protein
VFGGAWAWANFGVVGLGLLLRNSRLRFGGTCAMENESSGHCEDLKLVVS